jgi:hypothetical protein
MTSIPQVTADTTTVRANGAPWTMSLFVVPLMTAAAGFFAWQNAPRLDGQ